jgi:hypothetical protein
MEQRSASGERAAGAESARAQRAVTVAEHVGERASVAVQSVRRAGLKPALERSFGCEPEQIGGVIAQEPAAGSHLARNSMVTLYVGAPGDEQPAERGEEAAGAAASVAHADLSLAGDRGRPTRRKPGLAASTARPIDPPPPPQPGWQSEAPTDDLALADSPTPEELVERTEALFAEGRGRGAWHLRARLAALSWGHRWRPGRASRRWGALVVTLLLAVGLASAIGSRSGAARSATNGVHESAAAPTSHERVRGSRRKPPAVGSATRVRPERRGARRQPKHAARSKRRHMQATGAQRPAAQRPPVARALPASSTRPPPAAPRPESEFSP